MAGIYFHIPFCKHKCSYCDFYSIKDSDGIEGRTRIIHRRQHLHAAQAVAGDLPRASGVECGVGRHVGGGCGEPGEGRVESPADG